MHLKQIALLGNPNTGKSSVFNHLTGLRQQVGNFPGVTVDKRTGTLSLGTGRSISVIDLPGTYSIFPRTTDEGVVLKTLMHADLSLRPDAAVVVADMSNLKRNLLLFSQVYDMQLPVVLLLSMPDIAEKKQLHFDLEIFELSFPGVPVIKVNGRTGEGIEELKQTLRELGSNNKYIAFGSTAIQSMSADPRSQAKDAIERFRKIRNLVAAMEHPAVNKADSFTSKLDKVLVHRIWGYLIFMALLLLIFQVIFSMAQIPMDLIDGAFLQLSQWAKEHMAQGVFTELLAEGIIPGLGGIVVFVPQIALLFFFIAVLEETGYMARVVFIMDKLVRPFGLSGKSVVPLLSSVACAIPGIMSARTIGSWKERMITIMVAPLMSCSARIPVFTLLIGLVIPEEKLWNFIDLQGLVLFMLYALGLMSALLVAAFLRFILRSKDISFLLLEMPSYKLPRLGHVGITVWEKVRVFVFDAGKVILAISIILWALASYGPSQRIANATSQIAIPASADSTAMELYDKQVKAAQLENSYIGIAGKSIEPAIAPLGFDWKMGIALITSFAAREVFVGSMATIYSVNEDFENDHSLQDRLREEKYLSNSKPVYTIASGMSLMIFYVYAMQCMATLAVVKRETKSWKWPLIQLLYMGVLAYIAAFITFQILS
ncbi:MAG: ferrous iron transporter B [Flavobacteriales bacterium]